MADLPVLIIDDEKHLCELFADILARENIEVKSANTAKAGLEILADESNEFGVVFSDVKLPDLNGIEVLKEIKRRRPQMPYRFLRGILMHRRSHAPSFLTPNLTSRASPTMLAPATALRRNESGSTSARR